eukprot:bmy_22432T0
MSPSKRSSQKYIIEGLTEKSSQIVDPWERLFKILNVVGMRCDWQMDKGRRSYGDILHRMKDLCRYMNNFDNEAHAKYKNQVVYSTMLVFFKNAFQYVNSIQPSLFQGWFKNFRVSQNTGLIGGGEEDENVYLNIVLGSK